MFFDCVLLLPQHRGQFGDAWVAATRGIKFLSKDKIKSIDLMRLCAVLEKFIISESGSSKKRFSLRLSSILLNGTVRIFKEKILLLQAEVFAILQTIHLPPGIGIPVRRLTTDIETPPTPKPKVRSKKTQKKPIVETPIEESLMDVLALQEDVAQLQDVLRPIATSDLISIREEIGRRPEVLEEEYPLGMLTEKELEEIDSLLPRGPDVPAPSISKSPVSEPAPSLERIQIVAQVHASKGTFIETTERISTPSIQDPAVQRKEASPLEEELIERTRQEPKIVSQVQQEIQQIVEAVPTEEAPQIRPTEEISVLKEIQEEDILRSAAERVKKGKKEQEKRVPAVVIEKAISAEKEKLFIKISKKTFVRINRCLANQGQYVDKECILPCRFRNINVDSLYEIFWHYEELEGEVARAGSSVRGSSIRESESQRVLEPSLGKRSTLERELLIPSPRISSILGEERVPSSGEPRQVSTEGRLTIEVEPIPLPTVEPMVVDVPVGEGAPQAPPIVEDVVLPIEEAAPKETVIEEHIPMETGVPERPVVLSPVIGETMSESRSKVTYNMNYKERHQRIIDIVDSWDFNLKMLTIEDLCQKPFYKLIMATVFSDLLTLCAKKFIILNPKKDSLELLSVEKGPRFLI